MLNCQKMTHTTNGFNKCTRSMVLRNLALRKKQDKLPLLYRNQHISRHQAEQLAQDPFTNDSHFYNSSIGFKDPFMGGRFRDRQGQYRSIEVTQRSTQQSYNPTMRQSVTSRISTLDKIRQFRENKIQREFEKLDQDLKVEQQKIL
jgi:hypothetical protein